MFVSTGHVQHGRGFWWDAIRGLPREPVARLGNCAFRTGDEEHLARWLQTLAPEAIDEHLTSLRAEHAVSDRALTPDELRALATRPHVTIGAHTRTHPRLGAVDPERQRIEIEGSRDDVEALTGVRPRTFAYPFGVPGDDFDERTVATVRAAGFTLAVANAERTAGGAHLVPRRTVPDVGGDEFARWLGL